MKKLIIGLTGTLSSGKGTVVDFLQKHYGFSHFSMSGLIGELFEKSHGRAPTSRDELRDFANQLRAEHGPMYIVDILYARAEEQGGDVIIESLRAPAEVDRIQELGGLLIGVDANPEIRYERAVARGSVKDNVSSEEFTAQEKQEQNPDDPTKQNLPECLARADVIIDNSGSLDSLHKQIARYMESLE